MRLWRTERVCISGRPTRALMGKPFLKSLTETRSLARMQKASIAIIAGDGIGREVTPPAFEIARQVAADAGTVLEAASYDWGSDYFFRHGRMMPADALETLRSHAAILLGAV